MAVALPALRLDIVSVVEMRRAYIYMPGYIYTLVRMLGVAPLFLSPLVFMLVVLR